MSSCVGQDATRARITSCGGQLFFFWVGIPQVASWVKVLFGNSCGWAQWRRPWKSQRRQCEQGTGCDCGVAARLRQDGPELQAWGVRRVCWLEGQRFPAHRCVLNVYYSAERVLPGARQQTCSGWRGCWSTTWRHSGEGSRWIPSSSLKNSFRRWSCIS